MQNKLMVLGMVIIIVYVLVAIFAPYIIKYDIAELNLGENQPPSKEHWCGTDDLKRYFSRLLYGTRYSLGLGLAPLRWLISRDYSGMPCCFFGGWVEEIIMRFCDLMRQSWTLLAIVISMVLGSDLSTQLLRWV